MLYPNRVQLPSRPLHLEFSGEFLESKYGEEEAAKRIYVTTDKCKGTLKELSNKVGYETFVVPDDVGGRYSVLTAVGLLPIAVSGCDIDKMMQGAADARKAYCDEDLDKNDCYKYAALRNILYRKGKSVEMMVSYEPDYTMMNEWLSKLSGESEGKDHKGIFPASARIFHRPSFNGPIYTGRYQTYV